MFFLPKVNADTQGIGLFEVLWKFTNAVINTWVKMDVEFHDASHGFRTRRGTGAAIVDLKISQELDIIYQNPFLLLLLDLRKAYDTLDCRSLLKILEGYGAGPKLCGILVEFWEKQ